MATAEQIREHYDVSNELFGSILDPEHWSYAAGRWSTARDEVEAHACNYRAIADSLALHPTAAVLDVGCGWGGFLRHALATGRAARIVGLTPSRAQARFVASSSPRGGEIHCGGWEAFESQERFDAVVAIESLEHYASMRDRRAGRQVEVYERFFRFCDRISRADAPLYVQTTVARRNPATAGSLADVRFILDEVFAGSALATLSDLQLTSACAYEIADLSLANADYIRTLAAWRDRLRSKRHEFSLWFGPERYAFYLRYFDACIRLFEADHVSLARIVFHKRRLRRRAAASRTGKPSQDLG